MTTSMSDTSPSTPERTPPSSPAGSPLADGRPPTAAGRLARIVAAVPDPDATAAFLRDGLHFDIAPSDDGGLVAVCDGDYGSQNGQGAIELVAGVDHRVRRLVFGVPDALDLAELAGRLGGRRVHDTAVGVDDPSGLLVTFEAESVLRVPSPEPSALRPRRMGHVNLKSPVPFETARFFTDSLGLRLSEFIGEQLYWMRTDTEHHAVALRPGEAETVHHIGMEVSGWHAYQPILDHLDSAGYKIEYGPGRHRPGRSLFVYVCDPSSGLRIELFADMVHINDPDAPAIGWEPGDRLTTTLNTWGPTPPESFLA
jgi:catechol 2,3-dioxygenase-like lactoylglutathione lyase family enzyme